MALDKALNFSAPEALVTWQCFSPIPLDMTFLDLVSEKYKSGYLPQRARQVYFVQSSEVEIFLTHLVVHYIFYPIGVHAQTLSRVRSLQHEEKHVV